MAHGEIISETLKYYVTSSKNLQRNKFYHTTQQVTCNFGQLQKNYNIPGFLYMIHTYCHCICLSHDIHMVTTSTYFMILPSVIFYINFSQYIKIYTCLSKTTIMHTLHINFFGCKWPMKKSYEKHWKLCYI